MIITFQNKLLLCFNHYKYKAHFRSNLVFKQPFIEVKYQYLIQFYSKDDKIKKIQPIKYTQPQKIIKFSKQSAMKLHTTINYSQKSQKYQSRHFKVQIIYKIDGIKNSLQFSVDFINYLNSKNSKQIISYKICNKPQTQLKYRIRISIKEDDEANNKKIQEKIKQNKNQCQQEETFKIIISGQSKNQLQNCLNRQKSKGKLAKKFLNLPEIQQEYKSSQQLNSNPRSDLLILVQSKSIKSLINIDSNGKIDQRQKQIQKIKQQKKQLPVNRQRSIKRNRTANFDNYDDHTLNKQKSKNYFDLIKQNNQKNIIKEEQTSLDSKQNRRIEQQRQESRKFKDISCSSATTNQVESLNKQLNKLQAKYQNLVQKYKKAFDKAQALTQQLQNIKKQTSKSLKNTHEKVINSSEKQAFQKQIKKLKDSLYQTQKNLIQKQKSLSQNIKKLQTQLKSSKDQNKKLQKILQQQLQIKKQRSIEQSLKPYKQRIKILQKQLNSIQQQKNQFQIQIKKYKHQQFEMKQKIKSLQQENLKQLSEITSKNYQIQKLNKKLKSLGIELKQIHKQRQQEEQQEDTINKSLKGIASKSLKCFSNNQLSSNPKLKTQINQLKMKLTITQKNLQNKQQLLKKFDSFSKQRQKQIQDRLESIKKQNKELIKKLQKNNQSGSKVQNNRKSDLSSFQSKMQIQKLKKQIQYKTKQSRQLLIDKSQLQTKNKLLQQDVVKSKQSIANILNVLYQLGNSEIIEQINVFLG